MLWTFPLQRFIAYPFVFLFFGAIMGSAWFGGLIAGFVAVVLSSFFIDYFFFPPLYLVFFSKESQSFFSPFLLFAPSFTLVCFAPQRPVKPVSNLPHPPY